MKFNLTTLDQDERAIYITGNFNGWNPKDPRYILTSNTENQFSIEIDDDFLPNLIEYKFTKGGWENVEIDQNGNITPNRKVEKSKQKTNDTISNWRLNWGPFKPEFNPIVEVIDEDFYIPQLDRYRKVWALLPHDYYKSEKKYPVLYLQDAQNLFNEGSPYGNWEIDKKLSLLSEYGRGDVIVIAVDHRKESNLLCI